MESSKVFKVVYFNKGKVFDCNGEGETSGELVNAFPYPLTASDQSIRDLFDEDEQYQIEIWKVKFTVETI